MKGQMVVPARRLFLVANGLLLLALVPLLANLWLPAAKPATTLLWGALAAALVLAALIDALRAGRQRPTLERRLPAAFAAGQPGSVRIRLDSASLPGECLLSDSHPGDDPHTGMPVRVTPAREAITEVRYSYRPARRGEADFGPVELWCPSPWGLWQARHRLGDATRVPVYPDFSWLRDAGLTTTPASSRQQGRHQQRRSGDGQEFHQLREYRSGDSLRQIDWPATARRGELISREYRDEQHRHLVLMLDGGGRMALPVEARTLFDHGLDSALLLCASSLDQGDRPGLLLFSGEQPLWQAPMAHRGALNTLLNQVYPLHPGGHTSDYADAARQLLQHWPRQALVVIITRLQPDDSDDLLQAVQLLRSRCRILIGDMLLPAQVELARAHAEDHDTALKIAAAARFDSAREALHARLRHAGVVVAAGTPEQMPRRLNQAYLALRRGGRL